MQSSPCPTVRLVLIFLGALLLSAPVSAQRVLFVDADALGSADGSSWANAFADLQQALALAASGDEVWVAEGVYYPAPTADRDASFVLGSGVQLYGGFDGNESTRAERDPSAHETVLSGDLGTPGDASDNAYHVVVASGVDATTILDGFTITGGNGDGANPRNRGAGLYAEAGSLTVRNCRIVENRVVQTDGFGGGAGGFFGGGTPRFEGVAFERNEGALGGGLWFREGVEATITDAVFAENTAASGGGVYSDGSSLSVVRSVFVRNVVNRGGGGVAVSGGEAQFLNAGFYGNVARTDDGDNLSSGAGISSSGSVVATNVEFVGNVARIAAGLSAGGNDAYTLTNVTFAANQAEEQGGGIRLSSGSDLLLRNAVLWGNTGGAVDATSGFATLRYVLVPGGCPPGPPFDETVCEALLDADPLFARPPAPGPDALWGTSDDDYGDLALQQGSPALDFGRDEFLPPDAFDLDADGDTAEPLPFDLVSEPRMTGTNVDLGAYERPPPVAVDPDATVRSMRLDAYPNPALGPVAVHLVLDQAQRAEVALFDVQGRRVAVLHDGPMAVGRHALLLDTAALPSGVYIVRLRGEAHSLSQRVSVLH